MKKAFLKSCFFAVVLVFALTGCGFFGTNHGSGSDEGQIVADPVEVEPIDETNTNTPPTQPPPTTEEFKVTETTPHQGDFSVPTNTSVTVTFNHDLNAATVNNSNVKLFDNNSTEVAGTVSLNNKIISFTPAALLTAGTNYSLRVSSVEDTEGNVLATPFNISFTTRLKLFPPVYPGGAVVNIDEQCDSNVSDDFEVGMVRAVFYTARIDDAGTNGSVRLETLANGSGYSDWAITSEESSKAGILEQGNLFSTRNMVIPPNLNMRSMDFKALKIELYNGDSWYLGGLSVQVLKKGCDKESDWTTVYFNPYVRTWISSDKPLIVSYDDAIAVFHTEVWNLDDAGTDDDVHVGTPFETKNNPAYKINQTPSLDYGDTDDFERNKTGYYGRTYFALSQGSANRLRGSFSSLTPQDIAAGFKITLGGDDGVDFHHFEAYLLQPVFQRGSQPFTGYESKNFYGWLDGGCDSDFPLQACAGPDPEISVGMSSNRNFQNLGEEPSDKSSKGFLLWASTHDDPEQ